MNRSYDSISREIVCDIIRNWKGQIVGREKEVVTYYEQYDFENLFFDIHADLEINGTSLFVKDSTGAEDAETIDDDPFIIIDICVSKKQLPTWWEEIYFLLLDIVRHEIEHITQGGENYRHGKPREDDTTLRKLINDGLISYDTYLLIPKEIDAYLQGIRLKAKKSKLNFANVIDYQFDSANIDNKQRDMIKDVWRERARQLGFKQTF